MTKISLGGSIRRPGGFRLRARASLGRDTLVMVSLSKNKWLSGALDYIPSWIELQLRASGQPGCAVAIALKDKVLLDQAFGVAVAVGRISARGRCWRIWPRTRSS